MSSPKMEVAQLESLYREAALLPQEQLKILREQPTSKALAGYVDIDTQLVSA